MKRLFLLVVFLILVSEYSIAQDLPLFSQKLTNSFLYNPSVAGDGMGSITFSNRTYWNGAPGAPLTNFISAHTPFGYHKFGTGFNLVNERIGITDNLYATGAFAYHLPLPNDMSLSMGLSSEFTNLRINTSRLNPLHEGDNMLTDPGSRNSVDFSFGLSFKTKFFNVGLASNRLATAFGLTNFSTHLSQFYTGFINLNLELMEDHVLEPTFVYRKLSTESNQWDAGLYYTFKEAVTLGASYRSGGVIHASTGLKFLKKYLVGYSFEMFGSGLQKEIGGTHEITLRMDFWDDKYYKNTRNSGDVMKQSIAFRRKSMSSNKLGKKPMSASSSKFKKKLNRNYIKSPTYRMNSSNKLNNSSRSAHFKKKSGAKSKNTTFSSKKRRKTNHKSYQKKSKKKRPKPNR